MRSNKTNTQITSFSAFQKLAEDVYSKQTLSGAIITTVGGLIILVLFLIELISALSPQVVQKMGVDSIARTDPLEIFINITMHAVPCAVASVDYFDETGHAETNSYGFSPNIHILKKRLDENGRIINKQLQEEPIDLRNPFFELTRILQRQQQHVHEVEEEYDHHEGCNLYGTMEFERVRGSFRIIIHTNEFMLLKSTQKQMKQQLEESMRTHNFQLNLDTSSINTSHTIHHLSFGPVFQGQVNSLNNVQRICSQEKGTGTFKYFLNIVPTTFEAGLGLLRRRVESYQYADTEFFMPFKKDEHRMNAVYFFYDLYPISIQLDKHRVGLISFLLRVSAVVGGGFAIMGLLDKVISGILNIKIENRVDPFKQRSGFGQQNAFNRQGTTNYNNYQQIQGKYEVSRATSYDRQKFSSKVSNDFGSKRSIPENNSINRNQFNDSIVYRQGSFGQQQPTHRKVSQDVNQFSDQHYKQSV